MTKEPLQQALGKAFQLGQTYWQQADSDSESDNRKSDVKAATFKQLVTDTEEAIAQPVRPAHGEWLQESNYRAGAKAGYNLGVNENTEDLASLLAARYYPKSAIAQSVPPAVPYAYAIYFPDQQREELVHELDDAVEDMTNDDNHVVTRLYGHPAIAQPVQPINFNEEVLPGTMVKPVKSQPTSPARRIAR